MTWQLTTDKFHRREWVKGDYAIVEMRRPIDEKEYFCYHKNNFIAVQLTPEHAQELCDTYAGKI